MFINNPDHMTKMAAMPLYGKNTLNSFSRERLDRSQRNIACSIGNTTMLINHDLWMTLTNFTARST